MTMDKAAIARAAALLGAARLENRPVRALPEDSRPADEADGFRVRDALKDWLGQADGTPHAGHKIGCTTPTMQAMLGMTGPVRGWIRTPVLFETGAELPASDFQAPGIECEIAFRIGRDFAPGSGPFGRAEAAARIKDVMPAIEVVDNRYGDWAALGVPSLIADDFFQAACVLGAVIPGIDPMTLDSVTGRTFINGEMIGQGAGSDVLGHPLDAVAWLAQDLAKTGRMLQAGQLVMTGSMVRPIFLERFPVEARIEIDGLGAVEVRLA